MAYKINYLIIIDWLMTPLMEIGADIALQKGEDSKNVEVLIIDDYKESEGFNKRFISNFSYFDIPKRLERIINSKKIKNITVSRVEIKRNFNEKYWPKEVLKTFNLLKTNGTLPINNNLKELFINNVNIGDGILSSIISRTKNKNPKYYSEEKYIIEFFNLFVRRYLTIKEFSRNKPVIENVVIFNGRFASSKSIEAVFNEKIKKPRILFYERSHSIGKFTLNNFKVHDRKKIIKEINNYWLDADNYDEAKKIAETFFKTKISGKGTDWFPYSKGIQDNRSEKFKKLEKQKKRKIVYFSSSEDEFESLGDIWQDKRFKLDQSQIIKELSRITLEKGMILIIRIHPNLINSSNITKLKWSKILEKIPKENLYIFNEEDNTSSYQVIEISDIVVVYGSTIGIESLYLKKPVIVTGSSFYYGTNAILKHSYTLPSIKKNIYQIIKENNEINKNKDLLKESSYPYAYWAYTHGYNFKNFKQEGPIDGKFLGYDLDGIHKTLSKINKLKNILSKISNIFIK